MPSLTYPVLLPIATIAFILAMMPVIRASRDDIGLRMPSAKSFASWMLFWVVWKLAIESTVLRFGIDHPDRWPPLSRLVVANRILALAILAPIAEELMYRGMLLWAFQARLRMPAWLAVVVLAVVFGFGHTQYSWSYRAFLVLDALVYGIARVRSRSVYVPMAMHMTHNAWAVCEYLYGTPWT